MGDISIRPKFSLDRRPWVLLYKFPSNITYTYVYMEIKRIEISENKFR